jgi:hypothetical protein
VNVQLSLILLTSLFFINGCSILPKFWEDDVKPIEVKKVAVERIKLNIESPKPLQPEKIEWVIITPDNVDKVWKKLKSKNKDLVLFGLTDDGYEKLSINMAEIRNFINSQRIIILKYKDYYEKDDSDN